MRQATHAQIIPETSPGDPCLTFWPIPISQVVPETLPPDPWHMARPLPLRLNNEPEVYGGRTEITEKNWMPFVYNNELYVTYHVVPRHMVGRAALHGVLCTGSCCMSPTTWCRGRRKIWHGKAKQSKAKRTSAQRSVYSCRGTGVAVAFVDTLHTIDDV